MSVLTATAVLEQLRAPKAPVLKLLAECRERDNQHVWDEDRALVRRFAELLIDQKHPTIALEVASRGLEDRYYPGDHELLYWRAPALVTTGNPTRVDDFVQELLAAPGLSTHWQTEGLSLAGRVRKDRATRTADPTRRRDLFRQAYDYYSQAYALRGHYFPGINAATLALLGGTPGQSTDLATRVRDDVRAQLRQSANEGDDWLWATLGEACLLLGDPDARGQYEKAVALARDSQAHGHIASMGRQVRLLAPLLPAAADLLPLFRVNPVIVFAGHNLDHPGDPTRFPADPALEDA